MKNTEDRNHAVRTVKKFSGVTVYLFIKTHEKSFVDPTCISTGFHQKKPEYGRAGSTQAKEREELRT